MIHLSRALLLSDAITPDTLARALFASIKQQIALERALVETGAIDELRLQEELARWDGPVIQSVVPVPDLVQRLPKGLCKRLLALPIRLDPRTGTIDVAVADGRNEHIAKEMGYHLSAPVRLVRAKLVTLFAAIDRLEQHGAHALAAPLWAPTIPREHNGPRRTPMWGTPIVSLDKKSEPPPSVEMPIPLMRSVGPDTIREPEPTFDLAQSSRRPRVNAPSLPLPDPSPILESLRAAKERDEIIAILLQGTRAAARRAAILVVKRDAFVGWSCTPELGSAQALRGVMIPTSIPSALAKAASEGTVLGPLPKTPAHEPLLAVMGSTSPDVAISPVKVAGKPALLIVADELADPALSTKHIDTIAEEAGHALARLVRKRA